MHLKVAILAAVVMMGFAAPAVAHHSFAMFDADKTITLSGTLKEFEWVNPHSWMHIAVADPTTGQAEEWSFEMGSPGQLGSRGLKPDSVKPGDKITIKAHPMKDGSHGGQYMSATFAGGQPIGNPGPANPR